ncbi:TRAP transporter small permease [Colwellia sp. E150_009]
MKNSALPSSRFFLLRWIDMLCDIGGGIAAVCLFLLAFCVTASVLLRYFFSYQTPWIQEVSTYLFMAIGFLAAAYALRKGGHFSITFLVDKLNVNNRKKITFFANLLGLLYSITFIYEGIKMVAFSHEIKDVSTGLLSIPIWIPQLLVPIGGFLLALQFFNQLFSATQTNKE